jgi:hypothetical protein
LEKIGGEIRRQGDSLGDRFGRLSEVCREIPKCAVS